MGASPSENFVVPDSVSKELAAAKLPEHELRLRLKILENVATGKTYFPHPARGLPETRNSKYWKPGDEGYVPIGSATEAIRDLWRTQNGIQCYKYSTLIMIKAMIDLADKSRISELDELLGGKVIPNDLPQDGIGTLFTELEPKNGKFFSVSELIPGDQVYFKNPYYSRLTAGMMQAKPGGYLGQQGYEVFYFGDGKVIPIYGGKAQSIATFREGLRQWTSVKDVAAKERRDPQAEDFQITCVRRAIAH